MKPVFRNSEATSKLFEMNADIIEETIQKRLSVYKKQTAPLIDFYSREGILKNVEGVGETSTIFKEVLKVLDMKAE